MPILTWLLSAAWRAFELTLCFAADGLGCIMLAIFRRRGR